MGSTTDWKNRVSGLEYHKPYELLDHPHQWRVHPKNQLDALSGVLQEVGISGALIAYHSARANDALVKIDGHARAGLGEHDWPVLVLDVNDHEADLLLASLDPLAAMAQADAEKLEALLHEVSTSDAAVMQMLANLADDAGLDWGKPEPPDDPGPQLDKAEELREKWGVELGQLWEIGRHRIMCGDCTDKAVVERVMQGERAELVLTDPPYGIDVVKPEMGLSCADSGAGKPVTIGTIRHRRPYPFGGVKNMRGTIGASHMVDATLYHPVIGDDKPFDPAHLFDLAGNLILFGGNYFASKLPDSRCWIVWDKNNTGNFADAELAWTSFNKSVTLYKFTWNGLVREGKRDIEGIKRVHPTQKPVGLFEMILSDFSELNNTVLDPYLGSGTTLAACERLGRRGRGIEISPAYVAVAIQRLVDMGLEARLVE